MDVFRNGRLRSGACFQNSAQSPALVAPAVLARVVAGTTRSRAALLGSVDLLLEGSVVLKGAPTVPRMIGLGFVQVASLTWAAALAIPAPPTLPPMAGLRVGPMVGLIVDPMVGPTRAVT